MCVRKCVGLHKDFLHSLRHCMLYSWQFVATHSQWAPKHKTEIDSHYVTAYMYISVCVFDCMLWLYHERMSSLTIAVAYCITHNKHAPTHSQQFIQNVCLYVCQGYGLAFHVAHTHTGISIILSMAIDLKCIDDSPSIYCSSIHLFICVCVCVCAFDIVQCLLLKLLIFTDKWVN